MSEPLVAGVELGGTKCVCILASGPDRVEEEVRLPTRGPEETLAAICAVLDRWDGFAGLGVASFGPVCVDRGSPDWGRIGAASPKLGWAGAGIGERLRGRYGVPVGFDTDVVGPALAEARWGAAAGLSDLAYVTVGTGVGAGLIARGRPVAGLTHSEFGHILPARAPGDDWAGACRYHGPCVEGLASGPAIAARAGRPADELPPDHPAWDIVAHALAQLAHALVMTGVPRRIVWGGGVMAQPHLLPRVRPLLARTLGGYLPLPELLDLDRYLQPAALGGRAGPLGAVALARDALMET
ncbi:ROK family protein [Sphingomonas lenta]|uniref:fructokinase n=1 Tax=Sphingomonas lenta TaxID=1141887 RepID=A0A2A2SIM8_9SPHN|nr:ROK family protein [Sphingomonas lenta]PAX09075.1 fructokinase [Sphingomonas lenta]